MRAAMFTLAVLALAYVGLCAALFFFQRRMIYFPQPRSLVHGATTLTIPANDGRVLVTVQQGSRPDALIYFGGNAEDVSNSLPALAAALPDHAIYLMHYRGYGGSSGEPTEAALFADAVALFDRVHGEHRNIVVVGRSLGGAVATRLASLRPVTRLVLVTPFDSLAGVAARHYPLFPVRWLLLDKFDSSRDAPQVAAPTLIVAAEHDEIIPRASTDALFRHFPAGVASFAVVAGTGHNTISESPEYLRLLKGVPSWSAEESHR